MDLIKNNTINNIKLSIVKLNCNFNFKVGGSSSKMNQCGSKSHQSINYIGSKYKLLDFIITTIFDYIPKKKNKQIESFGDLFAGTGVVSKYIMEKDYCKNVLTNDLMYYSYINCATLTDKNIDKNKIRQIINDINLKISDLQVPNNESSLFILNNYTEFRSNRKYFTELNGYKIDYIRDYINILRNGGSGSGSKINNEEYLLLIKTLLYAVSKISNITSVYGAYLKKFKPSALKDIKLDIHLVDNLLNSSNIKSFTCLNENILDISISQQPLEVIYLDPPYNSRNYNNNYHILETIAKYDYPEIRGKTGLRTTDENSKIFCLKTNIEENFSTMIQKVAQMCSYLFISYNNEGILSKECIEQILLNNNFTDVKVYQTDYQKFNSNKKGETGNVIEYLFAATKK